MPVVTFFPNERAIDVANGTTLLAAARQAGIVLESPCNGIGTCGKCRVQIIGDREQIEVKGSHHLSTAEEIDGWVLACQAYVHGDVRVQLPMETADRGWRILSEGHAITVPIEPYITKQYDTKDDVTVIVAGKHTLGTEPGDTTAQRYGVVVDIGTTTLVASLVNLITGEESTSASALNPQSLHAQDVLSRISLASTAEGMALLYQEVIAQINALIADTAQQAGVQQSAIYEVIFSGNTCMLHLATNTDPTTLGKYPYTSQIAGGEYRRATEHNLAIAPFGIIYLPPIISGFVGADITSGVLASQLQRRPGVTLFVDIGTNGEMVLGHDGALTATSTAAGPAFEGMNITFGMRAGTGAIETFQIDNDGNIELATIGNVAATGICGSGLLDIVGELVDHGVINAAGRFIKPESASLPAPLTERLQHVEGKLAFFITDSIYLSQKDIRQVQLAKGAIRAGIEFLLRQVSVTAAEVDEVLIAGSFGYHLRAQSLLQLGLLPKEFAGKIKFLGNTSKTGGQALLLNADCRSEMAELVRQVATLELANYHDFDRVFMRCIGFADTTMSRV